MYLISFGHKNIYTHILYHDPRRVRDGLGRQRQGLLVRTHGQDFELALPSVDEHDDSALVASLGLALVHVISVHAVHDKLLGPPLTERLLYITYPAKNGNNNGEGILLSIHTTQHVHIFTPIHTRLKRSDLGPSGLPGSPSPSPSSVVLRFGVCLC